MNKSIGRIGRICLTLFVLVIAMLGILKIFGVIDSQTLTDSGAKIGGSLLILVVASAIISWVQSMHE